MPTNRAAPATGAAQGLAAAKRLDGAIMSRADRMRFDPDRVLARRRANRELDRLLGIDDPYPDVRLAYGLRSSLEMEHALLDAIGGSR